MLSISFTAKENMRFIDHMRFTYQSCSSEDHIIILQTVNIIVIYVIRISNNLLHVMSNKPKPIVLTNSTASVSGIHASIHIFVFVWQNIIIKRTLVSNLSDFSGTKRKNKGLLFDQCRKTHIRVVEARNTNPVSATVVGTIDRRKQQ